MGHGKIATKSEDLTNTFVGWCGWFDWIPRSQLKGNGKPGWAVNKADLHKQIGNNTNWFK